MRRAYWRPLLVALTLAGATVGATTVDAQDAPQTTTTTAPTPPPPKPKPCPTLRDHNQYARYVLRYSHRNGDFRASVPTRRQLAKLGRMRACAKGRAEPAKYRAERRFWKHRHREWAFHRYIDLITPFGAWATPVAIVDCEGGQHGWNTWNHKGSKAAGPYQLLGWGAPMPANTMRRRAMHHIIAHRLYTRSGTGPWAASASCWGSRM